MTQESSPSYTVALLTLGCAKNEADSRAMHKQLNEGGFAVSDDPQTADFILLNTCAFIEAAIEESLDTILDLTSLERVQAGETKVLIAGCLPSRFGDELSEELPEVSAFVPLAAEDDVITILQGLIAAEEFDSRLVAEVVREPAAEGTVDELSVTETLEEERIETATQASRNKSQSSHLALEQPWAYVKISDGCSRRCSYCTIPLIRGPYRSYPYKQIQAEVDELVAAGVREIILVGQDTGIWREPLVQDERDDSLDPACPLGPFDLPELLAALALRHPQTWFRVMYVQPEGVSDKLLTTMAAHSNIASYLDMPLQHANEKLLNAMNRKGSAEEYLELLKRIRATLPDVVLRTTVMAGFPGETRKDFNELKHFLEAARFDYVGIFAYSREQGTVAAELPGQVSSKTAFKRVQALRDLCDSLGFEKAEEQVGREQVLLVCGSDEEGLYGRTQGQAPEVDGVTYLYSPDDYAEITDKTIENGMKFVQEQANGADLSLMSDYSRATPDEAIKNDTGEQATDSSKPGTFVRVRITEAILYDLYAEVLSGNDI